MVHLGIAALVSQGRCNDMFQIHGQNPGESLPSSCVQCVCCVICSCPSIRARVYSGGQLVQEALVSVIARPHKAQVFQSVGCTRVIENLCGKYKVTRYLGALLVDDHYPHAGSLRLIFNEFAGRVIWFELLEQLEVALLD